MFNCANFEISPTLVSVFYLWTKDTSSTSSPQVLLIRCAYITPAHYFWSNKQLQKIPTLNNQQTMLFIFGTIRTHSQTNCQTTLMYSVVSNECGVDQNRYKQNTSHGSTHHICDTDEQNNVITYISSSTQNFSCAKWDKLTVIQWISVSHVYCWQHWNVRNLSTISVATV